MGIREIYGVDDPIGDDPDDNLHDVTDLDHDDEPVDLDEARQSFPDDEDEENEDLPQTPTSTVAAAPSVDAVRKIEQLLAEDGHPINTSVPFLGSSTHHVDSADTGSPEQRRKKGVLHALLSGLAKPDSDSDAPERDDFDDPAASADATGAKPEKNAKSTLRPRHLAVIAGFAITALVAASVVGTLTVSGGDSDEAGPSSAPTSTTAAKGQRSAPIEHMELRAETCGPGSHDPNGAVDKDKKTAWVCIAPYNGVGVVLFITLPGQFVVTEVRALPGFFGTADDGSDQWLKNRVVSSAIWRFDGKFPQRQTFNGTPKLQSLAVPNRAASVVTLSISKTDAPQAPVSGNQTPSQKADGPSGSGSWFDDLTKGMEPNLQGSPSNPIASSGAEPQAFAVSTIEVVGYRLGD